MENQNVFFTCYSQPSSSNCSLPDIHDSSEKVAASEEKIAPIMQIPSYLNTAGNACASPGPLKKFRTTYDVAAQPQIRKPEQRSSYAELWMQEHHNAGFSFYSSNAPSIISNNSITSRLSAISIDTQLSVSTDIGDIPFALPQFQNTEQSAVQASTSFSENIDPFFIQQLNDHLLSLTNKLIGSDEKGKYEALHSLYNMAKKKYFMYCTDPSKLQPILEQFLCIMRTQYSQSNIIHIIFRVLHEMTFCKTSLEAIRLEFISTNGSLIHIICDFLSPEEKYCFLVTKLLQSLFSQQYFGRHYRNLICVSAARELKRTFVMNGGIEMCLQLMGEYNDEKLLYRIAYLITEVVKGDQNAKSFVDYFVRVGGIQIFASYLNHGSPRLLQTIAMCLAAVSDSYESRHQILDLALERVIQILGSTDIQLVYHATGFLANIQSTNQMTKVYLHNNKAIENLMCVLNVWSVSTPSSSAHKERIDDILDNVLIAIGNLTVNYPVLPVCGDIPFVQSACQQIMISEKYHAAKIFLNLLVSDRPMLRTRIFMILNRTLENIQDALNLFVNVYDSYHSTNYPLNAFNLLFNAIHEYLMQNQIDKQQKCRMLVKRILKFLFNLADYNEFYDQIVDLSRSFNNPALLLPMLNNVELEFNLMKLLFKLSQSRALISFWANSPEICNIFERFCCSNELTISSYAKRILTQMK
ncbi:armadillo repeat-containing protein wrm-1 [Ditylenchus destructor]|uniref:Armadillo repeat-containing protein wrm-1 n=1 Tax=Ditylenchus destructor TaxID=166010 RepID=A0AAD4NGJ5_9BILA|nr:armadillo repeat-containing protein wrm-1 [Ditylenchus destructor]